MGYMVIQSWNSLNEKQVKRLQELAQHPNIKPHTESSRQLPHKFFGNCILQKVIESSQVSHRKLILSVSISRNQFMTHEKVIVSCQHSHRKLLIFVEKDTASYQFSFPAASYWKLTTMSPGKLSVFVSCSKVIESQRKVPVFISHRKLLKVHK